MQASEKTMSRDQFIAWVEVMAKKNSSKLPSALPVDYSASPTEDYEIRFHSPIDGESCNSDAFAAALGEHDQQLAKLVSAWTSASIQLVQFCRSKTEGNR